MRRMNRKYIPGDRWVTCDICDFGYRFSQMRRGICKEQKGLIVCPDCFDQKHPYDEYKPEARQEGKLEEVR